MKLEVVDKRNPMFIRVATVADTDDHRVKVSVLYGGLALSFVIDVLDKNFGRNLNL